MAKVIDTLQLVPDDELRNWLKDFFVREYGESSLQQDVEEWYTSLGGRITQTPFSPVTSGNMTSITARPYYSVYGGFSGTSRYVVCLYGLLKKLIENNT